MKKLALLFALAITASLPLFAQNQPSNAVTVTVVAPPSITIDVAPKSYYQNRAASMTITVTTDSGGLASSVCTGTWDSTALVLTFTAAVAPNPAKWTASITTAMTATLGNHSVVINCPLPQLSLLSPVTLPDATVTKSYSANLASLAQVQGGVPPYTFSLTSGSLPTGLSLSSAGVVSGTPSGVGSFSFDYTVKDATVASLPLSSPTLRARTAGALFLTATI